MGEAARHKSKTTQWILLGVGAVAVIAAVMAYMLVTILGSTGLAFVEQHSAIDFPHDVSEVDTFDNGETFVVAHALVPDVAAFVEANELRSTGDPDALRPYVDALRPEHRTLPDGPHTVGASGQTERHRWHALVDERTGDVWLVVVYPDHAGDPAG